jgi:hypothetical protein
VSGTTWTLGGNQIGDLTYGYDAVGHVIEKSGSMAATSLPQAVVGNTFNSDNEMTVFNGTPLAYDANGNLSAPPPRQPFRARLPIDAVPSARTSEAWGRSHRAGSGA